MPALTGKMLLYDGIACKFRVFNTRSTDPNCPACSGSINPHEYDYPAFVGYPESLKESTHGISCSQLEKLINDQSDIIDLRPKNHFSISHLPGSRNIPYYEIGLLDPFENNKVLIFVDRNSIEAIKVVEDFAAKGIESCFLIGGLDA